MKLPDSKTELKTWPNGSLVVFLERLKNAVSTYQEDDMIEEVIERLKRQDKQVKALEEIAALEETWPRWEHRCLYECSRRTAIEALEANNVLASTQLSFTRNP